MKLSLPTAMRGFGLASSFLALTSCATQHDLVADDARNPLCRSESVVIFTDFAGAGMHRCEPVSDREFRLYVDHEADRNDRINPSPWFAFRLVETGNEPVSIVLDYQDFEHRYAPRLRAGNGEWQSMPASAFSVSDDEHTTVLTIDDASTETLIAGQPFESSDEIYQRFNDLSLRYGLTQQTIGLSNEGRPITAILVGNENATQLVVAMTRQHPPEVTGAQTFDAFAEIILRQLSELPEANFRLVLFPNVNPDGIDGGHWRNNAGGWDTNRNWFDASEPEIAAVQSVIRQHAEGRDVIAFMDFHSTWETLVYTHPFDDADTDMRYPSALHDEMNAQIAPPPEWIVGHNIVNGTSKNWAKLEFHTGGITIELGDDESAETILQIARSAVQTVFETAQNE